MCFKVSQLLGRMNSLPAKDFDKLISFFRAYCLNSEHVVSAKRFPLHLQRCRKYHGDMGIELRMCPFKYVTSLRTFLKLSQ